MSRPIAPHEAAIVQWLLDHAPVGDITAWRTRPVEELQVVAGCTCGCSSLDFQHDRSHEKMIADGLAVYPDGQQAGLILWGRDGEVVSLEVYDFHSNASHRVPEIANLRSYFEGFGGNSSET